jgi:hypothetical protein
VRVPPQSVQRAVAELAKRLRDDAVAFDRRVGELVAPDPLP